MTRLLAAILASTVLWMGLGSVPTQAKEEPAAAAQLDLPFGVMSYNITSRDKEEPHPALAWSNRQAYVLEMINKHSPGILAIQEHTEDKLIAELAGEYDYYLPPSRLPRITFFKKSRFEIVKNADGSLRAGETPLYVVDTDVDCTRKPRSIVWTMLRDKKADRLLFIVNLHLAVGARCLATRVEQVKTVHRSIVANNPENVPVVVMGDFNNKAAECVGAVDGKPITTMGEPANATHPYDLNASRTLANCDEPTFNSQWAAGGITTSGAPIDHVFRSKRSLAVENHLVDRARSVPLGRRTYATPSDHYPIFVKLDYSV